MWPWMTLVPPGVRGDPPCTGERRRLQPAQELENYRYQDLRHLFKVNLEGADGELTFTWEYDRDYVGTSPTG